jgi:hypothetical protein
MPLVRSALLATAACLIGAAAYAQPATTDPAPPAASSDMNAAPPASAPDTAPATQDTMAPPAGATADTGTAPVGAAANTSTTVDASGNQVIASQPVPDTRANRAAFGAPLSHAGKHTAPKGN